MNVNFTPEAVADLDAIHAHIAKDNPTAADRTIARILQAIAILENFPLLGHQGRTPNTREFPIARLPYFAVYTIPDPSQLDLIAVMHTSRQYPRDLA